jgi:hypothetical protein
MTVRAVGFSRQAYDAHFPPIIDGLGMDYDVSQLCCLPGCKSR